MSRKVGALAALLVAGPPALASARDVPALTGPVVDEAGLLAGADRERLAALSRGAWALPVERRVQLQYLVVPSLDEDLEAFAVRVFVAWKLGDKGWDNGVLVLVARDDRKVRIEVGYGAEGALTDAKAGGIIRATIAPAFREGRYGDGLYSAGVQILTTLGALPSGVAGQAVRETEPIPAGIKILMAMFLPLVLLFVFYWGWVLSGIVRNLAGVIRKLIRGEPVLEPVSGGGKVGSGSGGSGIQWSSGGTDWSSSWSSSGSGSWSSGSSSWSGGGGSSGGGGASGSW